MPPWLFKHIIVYKSICSLCPIISTIFMRFLEPMYISEILEIVNEAPKSPPYVGLNSRQNHFQSHNIIQIHNNVMWDWQYYVKYSPTFKLNMRIFLRILSVPDNTIMDLNNVWQTYTYFIPLVSTSSMKLQPPSHLQIEGWRFLSTIATIPCIQASLYKGLLHLCYAKRTT
jgi:hypothetical protein